MLATSNRSWRRIVALLLAAALLLLAQLTLIFPGTSRFSEVVHNALHVPWVAVLTLVIWRLSGSWLLTVLVTLLIAVGSEVLQQLTGRTPSLMDLFNNFLGLSLAACVHALFVRASRVPFWLSILGLLFIVGWTLRPTVMVFLSENWMAARGDLLYDGTDPRGFYLANFDAETGFNRFSNESLTLTLTDAPWSGVHFRSFPGAEDEPDYLRISLTVEGNAPLRLGVSAWYQQDEDPV